MLYSQFREFSRVLTNDEAISRAAANVAARVVTNTVPLTYRPRDVWTSGQPLPNGLRPITVRTFVQGNGSTPATQAEVNDAVQELRYLFSQAYLPRGLELPTLQVQG